MKKWLVKLPKGELHGFCGGGDQFRQMEVYPNQKASSPSATAWRSLHRLQATHAKCQCKQDSKKDFLDQFVFCIWRW